MELTDKTTQEYLNYFSERGIDVYEALSKWGDAAAVAEKVTRGEIRGSEAVEEILAYMQEQYGGLSEQMAGTYAGMVDNLADAEANAEAAYGEGYNEKRKEGIQAQMDWLNSGAMDEANRAIGAWQAELENTIESRDTLYSVIAHDLRSPLGSLKMMNNAILMMVDKERVGDEVYEMIQMMNKTSEEIFLLLDNLLKWAKNRLNKQHVYKQQTDINSIIDSTAEMYVPMAAQKGVKIILENLDKELVGLVDIDMLKTIIRNLISNAMKFSFEGGTITLSSRSEGDFVTVSVKDTGKGIKKEDQDKLLKQDSHFTTYGTKNEKGSGLGLMLCKDFVELHGGKLWFESEGEGKGTTFLFSMKALNQEA